MYFKSILSYEITTMDAALKVTAVTIAKIFLA